MNIFFYKYINKEINSKELISKLINYAKYAYYTKEQIDRLYILINDINNISKNGSEQEQYENILLLIYEFNNNRRINRNKYIYTENDIMYFMRNIKYGFVDKNNNKYFNNTDNFSKDYVLESPKQVIKNKIGVCWDQVELERYFFAKSNYLYKTYFICYYDNDKCPTHTFLVFEKNSYYYWFEHSWEKFRGIHKYNNINELLIDVRNKFINIELNNIYNPNKLIIYEYDKPKYGINVSQFYKHCEKGRVIKLNKET